MSRDESRPTSMDDFDEFRADFAPIASPNRRLFGETLGNGIPLIPGSAFASASE